MALISLGVLQPGGNGPMRATSNLSNPTAGLPAASYRIYQWPGNIGKVYVGGSNLESQSGDGMFGWVPEITSLSAVVNSTLLFYESPMSSAGSIQNSHDMSNVYVDTDNPTDYVLVAYFEV